MLHDIKDAIVPANLFLFGAIDFQTNSLLGRAASWCYQPCRWIQGREVVKVEHVYNIHPVESLPPLSTMMLRPWIQTLLRIVVYLPTLIGRCLQALAERSSADFKKDFAVARESVAYHHLLKMDFTQQNAYQKAEQEVELLVPTIEQREQLFNNALSKCKIIHEANEAKAAGFLCHYQSSLVSHFRGLWDFAPSILEALASDLVYGAHNFSLLLKGQKFEFPKDKDFFNEICNNAAKYLTEAQKKILAKEVAEGKLKFGQGYTMGSVILLNNLDFCGLDKMQVCKQLLSGITRDDSTDKVEDKVSIQALQGPARGLVYELFDDFAAFFSYLEWNIEITDVVYMKSEAAKRLLKAQVNGHINLALNLSKLSLDQIKIILDLLHSSEELFRQYTDCFHNIYHSIHEKRLNISSDKPPVKTKIITRHFLSSLSEFNLKYFCEHLKKAYLYSIKNYLEFSRDLRNLNFEDYYRLDNLAQLQALITSIGHLPRLERQKKRDEWLMAKFPPFSSEHLFRDDVEEVCVELPLQYFNEMHKILTSHAEVFEKYVKYDESVKTEEMKFNCQYINEHWRKDLPAAPQDPQEIIL